MDEIDRFAEAIRNPKVDPVGGPLEADAALRQRIISSAIQHGDYDHSLEVATGKDLDALGAIRGIRRKGLL